MNMISVTCSIGMGLSWLGLERRLSGLIKGSMLLGAYDYELLEMIVFSTLRASIALPLQPLFTSTGLSTESPRPIKSSTKFENGKVTDRLGRVQHCEAGIGIVFLGSIPVRVTFDSLL